MKKSSESSQGCVCVAQTQFLCQTISRASEMGKLAKFAAGLGVGVATGAGLYVALASHRSDLHDKASGVIETFHGMLATADTVRAHASSTSIEAYIAQGKLAVREQVDKSKNDWNQFVYSSYRAILEAKNSQYLTLDGAKQALSEAFGGLNNTAASPPASKPAATPTQAFSDASPSTSPVAAAPAVVADKATKPHA
eukprot:m.23990 g.23990  ORF g.23990 m.23990 type:complete len:196 (-) comp8597_c1_seq1:65-652(-)